VISPVRTFSHTYRQHRFAILFSSLLLTIAGQPLLTTAVGIESDLLQDFLALNVLAAIFGSLAGRIRQVLVAFFVIFVAFRIVGTFLKVEFLMPISEAVWVLIALPALGGTLRAVLRRGPVDRERIFAALSAYVLAGLVFGVIYWSYEQVWPGSFSTSSGAHELSLWHLVYFSFVTIASLGYGDIVPVSDAARGMAVLEVMSGQMYLAVLVARLVSLHATQERIRSHGQLEHVVKMLATAAAVANGERTGLTRQPRRSTGFRAGGLGATSVDRILGSRTHCSHPRKEI
jgi:hypothetical protein